VKLQALYAVVYMSAMASQDSADGPTSEHLEPLKFLIGTWTGQGKLDGGEAYTDEYRFEWMQNRQFIRVEYALKVGDAVRWSSTSIIGYDPEKKKLVGFVFERNGALARSECVKSDKSTWVFEDRAAGPAGVQEGRVTHTKVDADTFSVTVEVKKDGKLTPVGSYHFKRKK